MEINKVYRIIVGVMLLFISICSCTGWAIEPPAVGSILPDINLPLPKDRTERSYLGISGFGSFKIPQIKSQVVIIEIFSMYCPYCQKEAPRVNELYRKIAANPALAGKIKLIGIGVGNSPFEVDVFKKKYNIAFPLFSDGDFSIHKKVGEVRTPYFIGVKINPDQSHQVFYSKLGAFEGVDQFLGLMIKMSGIK